MSKAVVIVIDDNEIKECYECASFDAADKKAEELYKEEFEKRGLPADEYHDGIWRYHAYYIDAWRVEIKDLIEC